MSSLIRSAFFCVYFRIKREQKLTSKINELKHFHLKSKLSQVSVMALPN